MSRLGRWMHATLAWLAVVAMAGSTSAQPPSAAAPSSATRLRLVWQAPQGCPSAREVELEVARLVIEPIDSLLPGPLDVDATIVSAPGGFQLRLTMRDTGEPRSRELAAPTCAELAGAAALVMALTIDPTLLTKPRPAPAPSLDVPPPAPSTPPPPAAPWQPVPVPAPPPVCERPAPDTTWVTALGASLAVGMWPNVASGPSLLGAVEHRSLRAELSLSTSTAEWQSGSSGGAASLRSWVAAARGCWLGTRSALGLGPCAGFELGALHGVGAGVARPHSATLPWLAPSLGVVARLRVRPNAEVVLEADALKPLIHNGFELAGQQIYRFRPSSFAAVAGVFLSAVWP